MNKEDFLNEVERRLSKMFYASKEGYKNSTVDKHRLEGFMQAGVFLGLVSNKELSVLMDAIHHSVFGISIKERRDSKSDSWKNDTIDYSVYDQPTYERNQQ